MQPQTRSLNVESGSGDEHGEEESDVDAVQSIMDLLPEDQQAELLKDDYSNLPFLRLVLSFLYFMVHTRRHVIERNSWSPFRRKLEKFLWPATMQCTLL